MNSLKQETLTGFKWSAFNSVGGRIVSFLIGVVLARLLSPVDFGYVGMTAIFFSLAYVIVDSGFSNALIRKIDLKEEDKSTVFFFNIGVSCLLFVLLYFLSDYIADYLNAPILSGIVKLSSLSFFVGAFGSVQNSLMIKTVNFKTPAIITLCSQVFSGLLGIALAYLGYGVWALVWQSFSATCIRTISLWIVSDWRPNWCFSIKAFKELFGFGGNLAINGLLDIFFRDGIGLIIGRYYTPQQLGYYTRGQHTAQLPSSFLYGMVGNVTFPVLSKVQNDDEQLLRVYRRFMRSFSLVVFFAMILLAAVAKPFTIFVFSEKWSESIVFLQLFSITYMFYHVHALNFNYLMVKGRSDWALKKEIINKSVKIVLLILLIPYGVKQICIAFFISSVFDIFVNTIVTGCLFKYGFFKQFSDFSPYLIISLISCIPAFVCSYLIVDNLIALMCGIGLSTLLYIGLLTLKKDKTYNELLCTILKKK